MEQTIHHGRRWSTANAYLRPALKRQNVSLVKGLARRIVIENQRATGVEIEARKQIQVVKARREVVLAASSINSPKTADAVGHRARQSTSPSTASQTIADRPGVGQNLQDHMELYIQQESLQPITLYSKMNLFSKALIGAEWLFFKTGIGASNHFEAAAFVRSRPGIDYPDIQYHFIPVAIRYDGKAAAKAHGFQAHVGPMRSKSRGAVTLRSADPGDKPVIRFNYMSHPDDWAEFRHAIRLTREIFGQPAFDPYRGREISPGADKQSDAELDAYIRDHAESAFHPCGTCRMGRADDPIERGRSRMPGDRRRGPARRRFLDLPARHQRQPQRALDHDRRKGRRPHPRQDPARALQPGTVDQPALAGERPVRITCRDGDVASPYRGST